MNYSYSTYRTLFFIYASYPQAELIIEVQLFAVYPACSKNENYSVTNV